MNNLKIIQEKVAPLRILVVDDEELIRESMVSLMGRLFDNVDSAVDGEDGLKKFRTNGPYDIVLTDVRMPKMSGGELVKQLREMDKQLFIAVMSGSPEDLEENFEFYDVFLAKPIGLDEIIRMLETIIESKGL